jgi:hypothetical protein
MRVLIAGILGGIAMFIWTAIAHVATPLGFIGISQMQNEQATLDAMHASMGEKPGLYFFPYADPNDPQAMEKMSALEKTNPSGWIVYHPPGQGTDMTPITLGSEFVKQTAQAIIAAFLLSMTVLAGFGMRVAFVALIGVSASLATNASYFIWYGFPLDYTLAQIFIEIVSAFVAGLAIAFWLGRSQRSTA